MPHIPPKPAAKLRWPHELDGVPGYMGCEVSGAWLYSMQAMTMAVNQLRQPESLAQLSKVAGLSGPWVPGEDLLFARSEPWGERGGWVSLEDWRAASMAAMEAQCFSSNGSPRQASWKEGGWCWSPQHGCWMTPTYRCVSRGSPRHALRCEAMDLQSMALTLWQWDKDPIHENRSEELRAADLARLAEGMSAPALGALLQGIRGVRYDCPEPMGAVEAMLEKALLEEQTEAGSGGGARRL